jgi:hypothetical protein
LKQSNFDEKSVDEAKIFEKTKQFSGKIPKESHATKKI